MTAERAAPGLSDAECDAIRLAVYAEDDMTGSKMILHNAMIRAGYAAWQAHPQGQGEPTTEMIDAAMVEMENISPPMKRGECKRLIRAALYAVQGQVSASVPRAQAARLVALFAGYASMCWEPKPTGVFASERCSTAIDDVLDKLYPTLAASPPAGPNLVDGPTVAKSTPAPPHAGESSEPVRRIGPEPEPGGEWPDDATVAGYGWTLAKLWRALCESNLELEHADRASAKADERSDALVQQLVYEMEHEGEKPIPLSLIAASHTRIEADAARIAELIADNDAAERVVAALEYDIDRKIAQYVEMSGERNRISGLHADAMRMVDRAEAARDAAVALLRRGFDNMKVTNNRHPERKWERWHADVSAFLATQASDGEGT